MLVSVIIPAYCTEEYVEEAIQSALKQDYPQLEILLVDDGSPDSCPRIMDGYAAKYENVTVLHQENRGLGAARNAGLLQAKGEYVLFLDSDDCLDGEGAVRCLADKAKETGADIVIGYYRKIKGQQILDVNMHHLRGGDYTETSDFRFEGFYRYGHLAYNWGKLYRREFLVKNGLLIPVYPFTQDKAHNMLCYAYGAKYAFVKESVYLYRNNENSVTFRYKENLIPVWISIASDFHETLREKGREDTFRDITAFHIFFGSFFIVKQELAAGHGIRRAVEEIRRYGQDPFVEESMERLARGEFVNDISSRRWRFLIRSAALIFHWRWYHLFTIGICLLRGLHIDGIISDKRNKRIGRRYKKSGETVSLEEYTKKQELSGTVSCLCSALREALTGDKMSDRDRKQMEVSGGEDLVDMALRHRVLPMLYEVLEANEERISEKAMKETQRAAEKTVKQNYRLLFLTRSLVRLMEREEIPVIVLKGCGVASYYPVPEYRKSGDVDLLFENMESVLAAGKVLEGLHYTMTQEQHANHHLVFQSPEGIDIELHAMLAEPFDDERINRRMDELLPEYFKGVRTTESMGVPLPTARDELQALELLLHMLQHFLRAGFGLKLLTDWVVFWNRVEDESVAEKFRQFAAQCGVEGFAKAVTLVCEKYLGLREGIVYGSRLEHDFSRHYAQQFLMDIVEAEEFGKADKNRMVALRGHGIMAYAKEFHYQMRMNYPKESKSVWKWPYLWIRTFVVFLRNNRRLQRGSVHSILKNAGKRANVVEQMRLFQK